jgi:hypothetical protein
VYTSTVFYPHWHMEQLRKCYEGYPNKVSFINEVIKFWSIKDTKVLAMAPIAESKIVDLYELYNQVTMRGGYDAVCASKRWNEVAATCGIQSMLVVFQMYQLYLLQFEKTIKYHIAQQRMGQVGQTPQAQTSQPAATGTQSSSATSTVGAPSQQQRAYMPPHQNIPPQGYAQQSQQQSYSPQGRPPQAQLPQSYGPPNQPPQVYSQQAQPLNQQQVPQQQGYSQSLQQISQKPGPQQGYQPQTISQQGYQHPLPQQLPQSSYQQQQQAHSQQGYHPQALPQQALPPQAQAINYSQQVLPQQQIAQSAHSQQVAPSQYNQQLSTGAQAQPQSLSQTGQPQSYPVMPAPANYSMSAGAPGMYGAGQQAVRTSAPTTTADAAGSHAGSYQSPQGQQFVYSQGVVPQQLPHQSQQHQTQQHQTMTTSSGTGYPKLPPLTFQQQQQQLMAQRASTGHYTFPPQQIVVPSTHLASSNAGYPITNPAAQALNPGPHPVPQSVTQYGAASVVGSSASAPAPSQYMAYIPQPPSSSQAQPPAPVSQVSAPAPVPAPQQPSQSSQGQKRSISAVGTTAAGTGTGTVAGTGANTVASTQQAPAAQSAVSAQPQPPPAVNVYASQQYTPGEKNTFAIRDLDSPDVNAVIRALNWISQRTMDNESAGFNLETHPFLILALCDLLDVINPLIAYLPSDMSNSTETEKQLPRYDSYEAWRLPTFAKSQLFKAHSRVIDENLLLLNILNIFRNLSFDVSGLKQMFIS